MANDDNAVYDESDDEEESELLEQQRPPMPTEPDSIPIQSSNRTNTNQLQMQDIREDTVAEPILTSKVEHQ